MWLIVFTVHSWFIHCTRNGKSSQAQCIVGYSIQCSLKVIWVFHPYTFAYCILLSFKNSHWDQTLGQVFISIQQHIPQDFSVCVKAVGGKESVGCERTEREEKMCVWERKNREREGEKESREFCAVSPQQETEGISHGNAHKALFPCRSALTIPRTLRSEDASLQVLFRKAGN